MRLNNLVNDNEEDSNYIEDLCQLILFKYKDCFSKKEAYELAKILYENEIRNNMFFEEKYDIDEIVYHVYEKKLNKDKIIKFPKTNQSFDFREEILNNDTKIFKFNRSIRK